MNKGGKQTTLFQTWAPAASNNASQVNTGPSRGNRRGATITKEPSNKKRSVPKKNEKKTPNPFFATTSNSRGSNFSRTNSMSAVNICDDDSDEELLLAMEESLRTARAENILIDDQDNLSLTSANHQTVLSNEIDLRSNENLSFDRNRPTSIGNSSTRPIAHFSSLRPSFGDDSKDSHSSRISTLDNERIPIRDNPEKKSETFSNGVRTREVALAHGIEDIPGFDLDMGQLWIYPTNYPTRDYQFNIVHKVLFENTMVTLPTGLGKTFIAAVAMYNFYRWFPTGKIVFMAPTKPLVTQQIEACHDVTGIPMDDTAEMTGAMQPIERRKAWAVKRLFFLTPQVMMNDLSRGVCPAAHVKCIVVDEAHKALGNHAYCQVIKELVKYTQQFRVVALSATPGSDIKAVQQVISNLLISHMELRTEESADIQQYTHERKIDKIVVPLGDVLTDVKEKYLKVVGVVVTRLQRNHVLHNGDPRSMAKFSILKSRDMFRQNPPEGLARTSAGAVEGDFALCISLFHGLELLQAHGLRSLYNYLNGLLSGDKGYGRTKAELMRNVDFTELLEDLRVNFDLVRCADPNAVLATQRASQIKSLAIGHPKMARLEEIVVEHFNKFKDEDLGKTRVMIFSQYRDSVNEITEILSRHRPLVKVMSFVGHSTGNGSSKGFSQKDQLMVMKQFREGGYNTLVSTSVGEEGLDIGDVDLIICFDAHKSPVRIIQRMGRTGRKREGRIVMLVSEGKEEQIYNTCQMKKKSIHKVILSSSKSLKYYQASPRMVPSQLNPVCHRMNITVPQYFAQNKAKLTSSKPTVQALVTKPVALGRKVKPSKDGFLTDSELAYWSEHLKVNESTIPRLPESTEMLSLRKKKLPEEHNVTVDVTTRKSSADLVLCLDEWLPWQNRLQDVHIVDHSLESRHLVELIEFINLQGCTTDDVYDTEMAAYLDMDDVISKDRTADSLVPPVKQIGIERYCTDLRLNTDEQNVVQSKEVCRLNKIAGKRPMKKMKSLTEVVSHDVEDDSDISDTGFVGAVETSVVPDSSRCNDLICEAIDRDRLSLPSSICLKEITNDDIKLKDNNFSRSLALENCHENKTNDVINVSIHEDHTVDLNDFFKEAVSLNISSNDGAVDHGVPSPPSIDDAVFTMNQLETIATDHVGPVDILHLIDQWESDKVNVRLNKYIAYANGETVIPITSSGDNSCSRVVKKVSLSSVNISVSCTSQSKRASSVLLKRKEHGCLDAGYSPSPNSPIQGLESAHNRVIPSSPCASIPNEDAAHNDLRVVNFPFRDNIPQTSPRHDRSSYMNLNDVTPAKDSKNVSHVEFDSAWEVTVETDFFRNAKRLSSTPKCIQLQLQPSVENNEDHSFESKPHENSLSDRNCEDGVDSSKDSFEMNDEELLAGCLTPSVVGSRLSTAIEHCTSVRQPAVTAEHCTSVGQHSVTQLTFTQALACLHNDTTKFDTSIGPSYLNRNKDTLKLVTQNSPLLMKSPKQRNQQHGNLKLDFGYSYDDGQDQPLLVTASSKSFDSVVTKVTDISAAVVKKCLDVPCDSIQPRFDLGFDLDFDDDEDLISGTQCSQLDDEIIPPSPTSATTSLTSSLRSKVVLNHTISHPIVSKQDERLSCFASITTTATSQMPSRNETLQSIFTVSRPLPSNPKVDIVNRASWPLSNDLKINKLECLNSAKEDCPIVRSTDEHNGRQFLEKGVQLISDITSKSIDSEYNQILNNDTSVVVTEIGQSQVPQRRKSDDKPNFNLTFGDFDEDWDEFHPIDSVVVSKDIDPMTSERRVVEINPTIHPANSLGYVDLTSPEKENVYSQRVAIVQPTVRAVIPESSVVGGDTLKRDRSSLETNFEDDDNEDEESFVHIRKKPCRVLMSPDSPITHGRIDRNISALRSRIDSTCQRSRVMVNHSSSDTESPLINKAQKICRRVVEDDDDDDTDEDFQDIKVKKQRLLLDKDKMRNQIRNTRRHGQRVIHHDDSIQADDRQTRLKRQRKRKNVAGREFLEVEAEVSSDDQSEDDEDGSDLDDMDDSFINDETQSTQAVQDDSVNMHAVYLKSVKSPQLERLARYRMKYQQGGGRDAPTDIFSQINDEEEEEDDYEEDSFCVATDCEEEEEEPTGRNWSSDPEITILQERRTPNRKTRLKKSDVKFTRRRIVQLADSSLEEDLTCDPERSDGVLKQSSTFLRNNRKSVVNLDTSRSRLTSNHAVNKSHFRKSVNLKHHGSFDSRLDENKITVEETWLSKPCRTGQNVTRSVIDDYTPSVSVNRALDVERLKPNLLEKCENNFNHVKLQAPQLKSNNFSSMGPPKSTNVLDAKATNSSGGVSSKVHSKNLVGIVDSDVPTFSLGFGLDFFDDFPDDSYQRKELLETRELVANSAQDIATAEPSSVSTRLARGVFPNDHPTVLKMEALLKTGVAMKYSDFVKLRSRTTVDKNATCVNESNDCTSNVYETKTVSNTKNTPNGPDTKSVCSSSKSSIGSTTVFMNSSVLCTPNGSCTISQKVSSPEEKLREERIRLSLQKKEEFRKKFIESNASSSQLNSTVTVECNQSSQPAEEIAPEFEEIKHKRESCAVQSVAASSTGCSIKILVDSKELSSAQVILSCLRFQHKAEIAVKQLTGCDYIISNRMGIERKIQSDFTNGANKVKLLQKMQLMSALFERPCLIVEKDSTKPGEKALPLLKSQYSQHTLACLAQMSIKVLFTDSQDETATLIAELCLQEKAKNFDIKVDLNLTESQEQALKFYSSLSQLSYISALNATYAFKTIGEFINSSSTTIEKKCRVPRERAQLIYNYIRHRFNTQMTGIK